ncbi:folylpolyglutamate synthase/dihydrofolate synthase family protein [soil metagenome]
MTYQETLNYLYQQLPMYQRIGNAAFKKSLDNILVLCEALNQPQTNFRSVHIAGTNGKGSSSNMLAAVLQAAGYKTGLYTSPHLKSFTERIKINGQDVPEEYVVAFVGQHQPLFEKVQPSFFEMTVALAFQFFADEGVDVAIIEVGLGGRLDSTNIITPLVSLITSIGLDHQALLGHDLPSIAREKAGIIKSGVPVVVSQTQPEIREVFAQKAASAEAPLSFADQEYQVQPASSDSVYYQVVEVKKQGLPYLPHLKLDLPGNYQLMNLPGVLKVLELLNSQGFSIGLEEIREGLGQVKELTQFKGRWQVLHQKPLTICDTGHNEDGIRQVVRQLRELPCRQVHFVFGTVSDKDISSVLALLPKEGVYYFCRPDIPRGLPVEELLPLTQAAGLWGEPFETVGAAYQAARQAASEEDVIFIGGSTFVVAEIPDLL